MGSEPTPDGASPCRAADERRVLLLPPTGRDAAAMRDVLAAAGIGCAVCPDMGAVCEGVAGGAGVVVVSEESLTAGADCAPNVPANTAPAERTRNTPNTDILIRRLPSLP